MNDDTLLTYTPHTGLSLTWMWRLCLSYPIVFLSVYQLNCWYWEVYITKSKYLITFLTPFIEVSYKKDCNKVLTLYWCIWEVRQLELYCQPDTKEHTLLTRWTLTFKGKDISFTIMFSYSCCHFSLLSSHSHTTYSSHFCLFAQPAYIEISVFTQHQQS